MQPFYQGQIDVFCALYAVLNGLRLTHSVRALTARNLFHATLLDLAKRPQEFKDVLEQKTDYYSLVDDMLAHHARDYSLRVERPFDPSQPLPSPEQVWERLRHWFEGGSSRAVLLRFVRFLPLTDQPYIHHWSCAQAINGSLLHLFDSSRDEGAIHTISKDDLVTDSDSARSPHILVEAHSLRFMACDLHTRSAKVE